MNELLIFVPAGVVGTIAFLCLPPIKVVQKWGPCRFYTNFGWKANFVAFLQWFCMWYVVFFTISSSIYQYDVHTSDLLPQYEDQDRKWVVASLLGLVVLPLAILFPAHVWSTIMVGIIIKWFVESLWHCADGNDGCYYARQGLGLALCFIFIGVVLWFAFYFANLIAKFGYHMFVAFTMATSMFVCAKSFAFWQEESRYILPFVSFGMGLVRATYHWFEEHCIDCSREEILQQHAKLIKQVGATRHNKERNKIEVREVMTNKNGRKSANGVKKESCWSRCKARYGCCCCSKKDKLEDEDDIELSDEEDEESKLNDNEVSEDN